MIHIYLAGSSTTPAPKGRYSHVADVAYGNIILVAGGYRGNVLDDLLAYGVPVSVSRNTVSVDFTLFNVV